MKRKELDELTGADLLRRIVSNLDVTREGFSDEYTAEQLLQIGRMLLLCEWDILPDQWTPRQVKEALLGIVPQWNTNERPKYTPRSRVLVPSVKNPKANRLVKVRVSEIPRLGVHYAGKLGNLIRDVGEGYWSVSWGDWTAINSLAELEPG